MLNSLIHIDTTNGLSPILVKMFNMFNLISDFINDSLDQLCFPVYSTFLHQCMQHFPANDGRLSWQITFNGLIQVLAVCEATPWSVHLRRI